MRSSIDVNRIILLQVLAHKYINLTIAIYVGISLTGFVCSLLLPIETKGRQLVVCPDLSSVSFPFCRR